METVETPLDPPLMMSSGNETYHHVTTTLVLYDCGNDPKSA